MESPEHDPRQFVLEQDDHSLNHIEIFLRKFRNGQLDDQSTKIRVKDEKTKQLLTNIARTRSLSYIEYVSDILESPKYTLLFVHDPSMSQNASLYILIDQLSDFVDKRLKLTNLLRVAAYDMSEIRLHSYFFSDERFMRNSFYLVSNNEKHFPIYNHKEIDANQLLTFALKNIRTPYRIPSGIILNEQDRAIGLTEDGIRGYDDSQEDL